MEKQRDIKIINLKKKLEEDKNNFENLYIEFVNNSEQKLKNGIYLNKKKLKFELNRIKNEYMNIIKLTIKKYDIYI